MAQIEIFGTKEVEDALSGVEKKISDMTDFNRDLADLELSDTLKRYEMQVDPEGVFWPIPNTRRRNVAPPPKTRKFGGTDKILIDSGTMVNSIGRAFGKNFAIIGTKISYAKYHQAGTKYIKKRSFIGVTEKTLENVKNILDYYLGFKK